VSKELRISAPGASIPFSATALVLAGAGMAGGGVSGDAGGGGAAGGLLIGTVTLAGIMPVVVGVGGPWAAPGPINHSEGQDSSFGTLTAKGGGPGGGNNQPGGAGGSGGGAGYSSGINSLGGVATPAEQGHDGGRNVYLSSPFPSGGGGGASGGGAAGSPSGSGAGGAGVLSSITGSSVTYGVGGQGGNWNSGAQRGGNGSAGGYGNPGIVVIRYLTSAGSATGGTITYDGLYTVHTFTASGTLTVAPSSGVAFAVSRDSGGILIGVRDNAAPQFSVSRDADGIMLGAWR